LIPDADMRKFVSPEFILGENARLLSVQYARNVRREWLGLALLKELVAKMGGRIGATSTPAGGASFSSPFC
jgi:signal transduction histidine kinase